MERNALTDLPRYDSKLEKSVLNQALLARLELFLQNHSEDYILEVLDIINQQKEERTSFIFYQEQYNQNNFVVNHSFEVIDQIINEKGLIDVNLADVKPISNVHHIYSLNFDDLYKLPENKQAYEKIIVYIWGNKSTSLQFVHEVLKIVRDKFLKKDIEIKYGTSINETLLVPRIDIISYLKAD